MGFIIYLEKEHCHTCKSKERCVMRCSRFSVRTRIIDGRRGGIRGHKWARRFSRREGPTEKWLERWNRTRGEKAEMRITLAGEGRCVVAGNREVGLLQDLEGQAEMEIEAESYYSYYFK